MIKVYLGSYHESTSSLQNCSVESSASLLTWAGGVESLSVAADQITALSMKPPSQK